MTKGSFHAISETVEKGHNRRSQCLHHPWKLSPRPLAVETTKASPDPAVAGCPKANTVTAWLQDLYMAGMILAVSSMPLTTKGLQ